MSSETAVDVSHVTKAFTLGLTGKRDPLPTILKNRAKHPFAPRLRREQFRALDDVTFSVEPVEVVGVVGRNGAGKSTLLKILSRITFPTSGYVDIAGRVGSLLEVGTGFHPELTGMENIYLNGTVLGMSKQEIDRRLDEIVGFAEVDKFLDTPVKRYSSGMRVRLAFAVAAHLEPDVLIIDEVLSVGDAAFQAKCIDKMRAIAGDDGRTVLYVSHNLVTVESLCPRSLLLAEGKLLFDGDTESTISQYMSTLPHAQQGRTVGEFDLGSADRTRSGYDRMLRRLEFRPNRGALGDTVRMGNPVQVVIEVENLDAHPDAMVMVTFGSETIQQICRLSQRMMPLRAASERCSLEHIVLDIPELPLTPGEYHLDAKIAIDPRHGPGIIDEVLHAAEFTVDPADILGNGYRYGPHDGPLLMLFDWEVRPAVGVGAAAAAATAPDEVPAD